MFKLGMAEIPKDKEWIDFSSLSMFQTCPSQYYWRIVKGLTDINPSAALLNGTAYHEALAEYYNARQKGISFEKSIQAAMLNLKGYSYLKDGKQIHVGGEILKIVDDPARNISVAMDTLTDYFIRWENENYSTVDTEVGFSIPLEDVVFIGKIDRRANSPLGKCIIEQKTTSIVGERWQSRGKPNLQLDGYIAAEFLTTGEMPTTAVLDVIPIHKDKTKRKEPFRIMTSRSEEDIDNWILEVSLWWRQILQYRDSNIWPKCTERCVPLLGFSCNYTTLCNMYPSARKPLGDIEIPGSFKVETWAPWEVGNGE